MKNESNVAFGALVAGAVVGLAILYVTHPRHGERRRGQLKEGCTKFGNKCKKSWAERLLAWRPRATGVHSDFQAEIRAHAPQYLQ